jgi:glutamate transport system substrate-binding protein
MAERRRRGRHRLMAPTALTGLVAVVVTSCGGSSGQATTVEAIRRRGTLVVGVHFDPGLATRNAQTGAYDGFNIRVARAMAVGIFGGPPDKLGDKVEFVDTELASRQTDLENGVVDIDVANFTITDERRQTVDFAGPYLVDHQDIMVASSDTSIKGVDDLNGKRVCSATASTSAANLVARAPQAQLTLFDTSTECGAALSDGRVDAVSTDESVLAGVAAASGGTFKLVGAPFSDEPWGIGLAKGDDGLRAFLDDRLDAMVQRGEWARDYADTLGRLGLKTPAPPTIDRYRSAPFTTTSTVA